MHNIQLLIFATFLLYFSNGFSQTTLDSSKIVRVLTYNIYHGETMKGDFDLNLIANLISSENPDLVALQEVDFHTNRAKNMDLPVELAIRTGLTPLFGKAMSFDGGEYGEGVLSKYSFFSTKNHALIAQKNKEPRSALEVNVEIQSGNIIRFIGTHLDHTKLETDRINQAKQLNELFTMDEIPSILVGDLNAPPESETMQILFKKWKPSFSENTPTFPSKNPTIKIDYILFRPVSKWKVLETKVICDEIASDHCAVLSVLQLMD